MPTNTHSIDPTLSGDRAKAAAWARSMGYPVPTQLNGWASCSVGRCWQARAGHYKKWNNSEYTTNVNNRKVNTFRKACWTWRYEKQISYKRRRISSSQKEGSWAIVVLLMHIHKWSFYELIKSVMEKPGVVALVVDLLAKPLITFWLSWQPQILILFLSS